MKGLLDINGQSSLRIALCIQPRLFCIVFVGYVADSLRRVGVVFAPWHRNGIFPVIGFMVQRASTVCEPSLSMLRWKLRSPSAMRVSSARELVSEKFPQLGQRIM